jgi:hypothetical protein
MEVVLLMTTPAVVLLLTWTTRVKVAEFVAASEVIQADTVPLEPAAGALWLRPLDTVHDTSVVLPGMSSVAGWVEVATKARRSGPPHSAVITVRMTMENLLVESGGMRYNGKTASRARRPSVRTLSGQ